MNGMSAHYDGHAAWYDENFGVYDEDRDVLRSLLGDGAGLVCLDVACGTGRYADTIKGSGYRLIGTDLSSDQLRIARTRIGSIATADAAALPFRDRSVDFVVGTYFHTDVEDFREVVAEIARVLCSGGRFVYIGLHPAFIGPFVDRSTEQDRQTLTFESGYRNEGWATVGSGGGTGLWSRVGGHHKTLTSFLTALIDTGLLLELFIELDGGGTVLPRNIAVSLSKP